MLSLIGSIKRDKLTVGYRFNRDGVVEDVPISDVFNYVKNYPFEKDCYVTQNGKVSKKRGNAMLIKFEQGYVRTVTSNKYFKDLDIFSNDLYFNAYTATDSAFLTNQKSIIKEIDKADLVDANLGTVITPFGTTDITHLSTGLKTLLNIRYLKEKYPGKSFVVNADEIGGNIMPLVYEEVRNSDISLYLSHPPVGVWDETHLLVNDIKTNGHDFRRVLYG